MAAGQANQIALRCLVHSERSSAQIRADPRDQLVEAERLGQKIVRPAIERVYFIPVRIALCKDDDRDVPAASNIPADAQACLQVHVDKNQIYGVRAQYVEGFVVILYDNWSGPSRCQGGAQNIAVRRAICDQQYSSALQHTAGRGQVGSRNKVIKQNT